MENLASEPPILGISELLGGIQEPQSTFVDPSLFGAPKPTHKGQSSLPDLEQNLLPIDSAPFFGSTLFKTHSALTPKFSAVIDLHLVSGGLDPITGLSLEPSIVFPDLAPLQSPMLGDKAAVDMLLNAEFTSKEALHNFFKEPDWQQTFQDIFGKDFNQDGLPVATEQKTTLRLKAL